MGSTPLIKFPHFGSLESLVQRVIITIHILYNNNIYLLIRPRFSHYYDIHIRVKLECSHLGRNGRGTEEQKEQWGMMYVYIHIHCNKVTNSSSEFWVQPECSLSAARVLHERSLSAAWVQSEYSPSAVWVHPECSPSAVRVQSECSLSAVWVQTPFLIIII